MSFQPRPYQRESIDKSVSFFKEKKQYNGVIVLPTGAGKSIVVANIAKELQGNTLVLQPSKEILEQNFMKFTSYGYRAGIYSASAGVKFIDQITFATIGSIIKKKHLFQSFKNIIIDECHLVSAQAGMYLEFIESITGAKVLGLTATPYRLSSSFEGAMLKFITRTRPKVFNKILHYVQTDVLFNSGFLAKLEYYDFNVINRDQLSLNSTGTDFNEASLRSYYRQIDMPKQTAELGRRILVKRRSLLVFCSIIEEAKQVTRQIPGAVLLTGDTEKKDRERILSQFKAGKIRCVVNVGVLTTGFDYPELEAVLLARSTMSLSLYYQMVGRVMRPFTYEDGSKKTGWVVDMGNNIKLFGKIETMQIVEQKPGLHSVMNNGKHLTNVTFQKMW